MPDETLTVYYDGACPLCRAEIGHYRRCRGAERIAFVDVAPDGAPLGPDLDRAAARARFHVRDADGRLRSGAAGFARLWSALPGWRWLGADRAASRSCCRSPRSPIARSCRCAPASPACWCQPLRTRRRA